MFFHTSQIFLVSHNNQLAFTEGSFSCGLWSEQDKTADCLDYSLTSDDAWSTKIVVATLSLSQSLPPTASSSWGCSAEALTSRTSSPLPLPRGAQAWRRSWPWCSPLWWGRRRWRWRRRKWWRRCRQPSTCKWMRSSSRTLDWLSTQDFFLEELLKEAWTSIVANPGEVQVILKWSCVLHMVSQVWIALRSWAAGTREWPWEGRRLVVSQLKLIREKLVAVLPRQWRDSLAGQWLDPCKHFPGKIKTPYKQDCTRRRKIYDVNDCSEKVWHVCLGRLIIKNWSFH